MQAETPADCRHSRAGFHALFVPIARRRDLSDGAKLLHQALVSMVRQRLEWTQAEIAEQLGWASRQTVWRATAELVAAGLLVVRRRGLGLPNEYLLLPTEDVSTEDIAAKAPRTPGSRSGHQDDRPRNAPARAVNSPQEQTIRTGDYGSKDYLETRDHGSTDFLETRYGRIEQRPPCERCYSGLHRTQEHGPTPAR
jgi:biotin operon repressor